MTDPTKSPPSIQIPQSDIFDIIQNQRYEVLKYMRLHPNGADDTMEQSWDLWLELEQEHWIKSDWTNAIGKAFVTQLVMDMLCLWCRG